MNLKLLKKKIEDLYYWDSNIVYLSCEYFGDEVIMIYEDDEKYNVKYTFYGCYQYIINHDLKYKKLKRIKDCTPQQIAYYLQNISVEEKEKKLLFKINAYPLDIMILCERVDIKRILKTNEL